VCILLILITYVYKNALYKKHKWQVLLKYRARSICILLSNVTKKLFLLWKLIVLQEWIISQLFMDYVFTPKHICPTLLPDENNPKSRILLFQYLVYYCPLM